MIRNDASVARCFLELQSKIVPSSAGLAGLLTNVATRRPPPHRSIVATVQAARVAQWIRRRSPKPKIRGSSPPEGKQFLSFVFLLEPKHSLFLTLWVRGMDAP